MLLFYSGMSCSVAAHDFYDNESTTYTRYFKRETHTNKVSFDKNNCDWRFIES